MILRKIGAPLQSPLLLLFRVFWGFQFAIAGIGKFLHYSNIVEAFDSWGVFYPKYAVALVGGCEVLFGIFLIFGLFTRFSALILFLIMVGAYFTADKDSAIALVQKFDYTPILNSTPLPFALAMIILFAFGPGKIALDYLRGGFNQTKEMP